MRYKEPLDGDSDDYDFNSGFVPIKSLKPKFKAYNRNAWASGLACANADWVKDVRRNSDGHNAKLEKISKFKKALENAFLFHGINYGVYKSKSGESIYVSDWNGHVYIRVSTHYHSNHDNNYTLPGFEFSYVIDTIGDYDTFANEVAIALLLLLSGGV